MADRYSGKLCCQNSPCSSNQIIFVIHIIDEKRFVMPWYIFKIYFEMLLLDTNCFFILIKSSLKGIPKVPAMTWSRTDAKPLSLQLITQFTDAYGPQQPQPLKHFPRYWSLFEGNPLITGGLHSQRPVTRCSDVVFDPHLNKRLTKQSRRRWFGTPSS